MNARRLHVFASLNLLSTSLLSYFRMLKTTVLDDVVFYLPFLAQLKTRFFAFVEPSHMLVGPLTFLTPPLA